MADPRVALLLDWHARNGRDLPWRRTRDPYRVLVSEVMLQQTQVSRVLPAYEAFVERFPEVHALAEASLAEVLTAWRGLGYHRRAVSLHRAAAIVVDEHGGRLPADLDALRALPGVGEYTARAVLAFAFEQDAAPVDTNIARILARAFAGRGLNARELRTLADELVPPGQAHAWGQALMDLGGSHCTARKPDCAPCPLRSACAWRTADGAADPFLGSPVRSRPQARFAGSDRFHRGRLVDALRDGPVPRRRLAQAAQVDDHERADRLGSALVAEGVAEWSGDELRLPGARR